MADSGRSLLSIGSRAIVRLSVIVAAWNGPSALNECLRSLARQRDLGDTEIIVASNFTPPEPSGIQFVRLGADATVPELRTAGMERAQGDIIALLEDHC